MTTFLATHCLAGSPVFAEGSWYWYWLGWFSSASSRGNVITLCVVIVCFSLFILMKK